MTLSRTLAISLIVTQSVLAQSLSVEWKKVVERSLFISLEVPRTSRVLDIDLSDRTLHWIEIDSPNKNFQSSVYSLKSPIVIKFDMQVTVKSLEDLADQEGLVCRSGQWYLHTAPRSHQQTPLKVIRRKNYVQLSGEKSWGQGSWEGSNYAELIRTPYRFVYFKSPKGLNVYFRFIYDPIAENLLRRIVESVRFNY